VFVWRQGIDTDRFRPRDRSEARRRLGLPGDRPVLAWVGRLVPVKGIDVLLDACARLSDTPFHLALVGDGPLRTALEARARASGLAEKVAFVGARDHSELADWYSAADWTLLPSRSEGLPNVLRESLSCGTPFIASDVGGISEIVGDSGSRLVPAEDPAALAGAIRAAVTGPVPRPALRPESWADSAAVLVEILDELRSRAPVPRVLEAVA
jgi:teichuronic acid biosynthesis glycosyltransferase TuaC